MKKWVMMLTAASVSVMIGACGQKGTVETTALAREEMTEMKETAETEEAAEGEKPADTTESAETSGEEGGFADNFDVDSQSAADFAEKLKLVTAAEDLWGLSGMASYPLYVGFADGSVTVNSAEEFLDLGEEEIFTDEMKDAIASADVSSLSPSRAGFVLSGPDGLPNMVFGVADGILTVKAMNYGK